MFIRTERLFLRPAWPEDWQELFEALSERDVQRNVGVSFLPKSVDAIRQYLQKERDPHHPHFFIYQRSADGAKLVGGIGLSAFDGATEVGYWISAAHRGQGFALEALQAVIEQAEFIGFSELTASHPADNPATQRVLEAAGFQDTGEIRMRFSVMRQEEYRVRVYKISLMTGVGREAEFGGGSE